VSPSALENSACVGCMVGPMSAGILEELDAIAALECGSLYSGVRVGYLRTIDLDAPAILEVWLPIVLEWTVLSFKAPRCATGLKMLHRLRMG
jgi:hypothetical protein